MNQNSLSDYTTADFETPAGAMGRYTMSWRWALHKMLSQECFLFESAFLADMLVPSFHKNIFGTDTFTRRALDGKLEPVIQNHWDSFNHLLARGRGYVPLRALMQDLAVRCDAYRTDLYHLCLTPSSREPEEVLRKFRDVEGSLAVVALRFAVLHHVLEVFTVHDEARPWNQWSSDRTPPDQAPTIFHHQLHLIHNVIRDDDAFASLRYNSELYRLAAERGGLRYENDPADTISRNLNNNFPRYFYQSPPASPTDWKAFFDQHPPPCQGVDPTPLQ